MAKKKGQGTHKQGARSTSSAPGKSKAHTSSQPNPVASQLKAEKSLPQASSSFLDLIKGKQARSDISTVNKGSAQRESMSKEKGNEPEKRSLPDTIGNIFQFLKAVDVERRKISWPARNQVIRETYSVLFLVAVITLLVLSFDWLVGHFIFGPLEHWARLHGGGIGKS
jgi:preprotein translocase SecE subunit